MASYATTTVTSNGSLDDNIEVTVCDCASNAITIDLPAIVEDGLTFILMRKDSSANANLCTFAADGTDTIGGLASITLLNNDAVRILSYGTDWIILSTN